MQDPLWISPVEILPSWKIWIIVSFQSFHNWFSSVLLFRLFLNSEIVCYVLKCIEMCPSEQFQHFLRVHVFSLGYSFLFSSGYRTLFETSNSPLSFILMRRENTFTIGNYNNTTLEAWPSSYFYKKEPCFRISLWKTFTNHCLLQFFWSLFIKESQAYNRPDSRRCWYLTIFEGVRSSTSLLIYCRLWFGQAWSLVKRATRKSQAVNRSIKWLLH